MMPNGISQPYPKPGPIGGSLIRQTIQFLRSQGVSLPLSTDILIAVSGGVDSVALGHLITHFGRRIVGDRQIRLLHINHQWRGLESEQDAEFVRSLGKEWGVPVLVRKVTPPSSRGKASWEEDARKKRKKIFSTEALKYGSVVFTAHQADDLAETLLWRLFTGAAQTHGAGIFFQSESEFRPFLKVRKKILENYLKENNQAYRQDSTNFSDRFLRARMRQKILPSIEAVFPRAVEHLVDAGLNAHQETLKLRKTEDTLSVPEFEVLRNGLFRAAGLKIRRSQWDLILQKGIANKGWSGEIHLPNGWKLTCVPVKGRSSKKWTLEQM